MHLVQAKTILSANNGVNIYRGCTHGCIYCDSRSDCYNMNHDFEDIEVKANAPQLLDWALASKRKKCMVGTGAMSDPYNPLELEFRLWRQCLEIIDRRRFGTTFLTKSDRFLRDIDLLVSINDKSKAVVQMTLTTADENLCRIVEPNVSTTTERYRALKTLQEAGVPNVVWLCPLLPYINDTPENLRAILDMCFDVGTKGIIMFDAGLTLRDGNRAYFYQALDRHFPGLREVYEREYGLSYAIRSPRAAQLMAKFHEECERRGVLHTPNEVFSYLREYPQAYEQLSLF